MHFQISRFRSMASPFVNIHKALTTIIAAGGAIISSITTTMMRTLFSLFCIAVAVESLSCGKNPSDPGAGSRDVPEDFKIAFIGDQGYGANARAVLTLIKNEGANLVLHQGDFDYNDDPAAWDSQINDVLGPNYPYFASIGNHDDAKWSGTNGYQQYLKNRLSRLGIMWDGDLGVKSTIKYKGIFMVFVGPGIMGSGHDTYIRDQLAADNSIWSICSWHKCMRDMQVGGKSDETGWGVYEEARKGGAIIATAHEHSYSRTHLLSSIQNKTVASRSDPLKITKGETFVFVSGLGGESIRDQERSGDWWASVYTSTQGAKYGALFGTFNMDSNPNLANFYFKDIGGKIVDRFVVQSGVERSVAAVDASISRLGWRIIESSAGKNSMVGLAWIYYHISR
jgi:hypothetical protein